MRSLWGGGWGHSETYLLRTLERGGNGQQDLGVSEITLVWKMVPHNPDESDAMSPQPSGKDRLSDQLPLSERPPPPIRRF